MDVVPKEEAEAMLRKLKNKLENKVIVYRIHHLK